MWKPLDVSETHSLLAMIIQGIGIALLALLCSFLTRSTRRVFLNRHAFYSLIEGQRTSKALPPPGCVAVVDVDGLKPINDTLGHASGDAVIRAAAGAIRSLVRADDLVFRWGGDEFLVVLVGVSDEEAKRRLAMLNELLARVPVPGCPEPLTVSVSFGVAPFSAELPLERAIDNADAAMYERKEGLRAHRR